MTNIESQISCALRILPFDENSDYIQHSIEEVNKIQIENNEKFEFDYIFNQNNCSQEVVFNKCVNPLISSYFEGYNATVLSFGPSKCGKSYTIGLEHNDNIIDKNQGFFPRIVEKIFIEKSNKDKIFISFFEIYSENIKDLLCFNEENRKRISIKEDKNNIIFHNLTEIYLNDLNTVIDCCKKGCLQRESTSKSHLLFIITLEKEVSGKLLRNKLTLVDLADSEKDTYFKNLETGRAEGLQAYLGMIELKKLIISLGGAKKTNYIPYMTSKLTHALKESFGGNSKTLMITCISLQKLKSQTILSTFAITKMVRNINNCLFQNENCFGRSHIQKLVSF